MSNQAWPQVPVDVALGGPLGALLEERPKLSADLHKRLTKAAGQLLQQLGIPALPAVTVHTSGSEPVEVRLHKRLYHCPILTLERVLATVPSPAMGTEPPTTVEEWCEVHEPSASQRAVGALVSAVVLETIKAQPQAVLAPDGGLVFLDEARGQQVPTGPLTPEAITPVLRELLALGIGVGRVPAVVGHLVSGVSRGLSGEHMAEEMVAELRPSEVRVDVHPGYGRELFGVNLPTHPVTPDELGSDHSLPELLEGMADALCYELGVRVPPLTFASASHLQPRSFTVRINDLDGPPRLGLVPGQLLIEARSEAGSDSVGLRTRQPVTHRAALIVGEDEITEDQRAEAWDPLRYLVLAISADLRERCSQLIDVALVEHELARLEQVYPDVVSMLMSLLPVDQVTRVLRGLLQGGISIRNLKAIAELLVAYDYVVADTTEHIVFDERLVIDERLPSSARRGVPEYVQFVRKGLREQIANAVSQGTKVVHALLLDPEDIELPLLEHAVAYAGASPHLLDDDGQLERIRSAIRQAACAQEALGEAPVLLTAQPIATFLREMLHPDLAHIPVLSYDELPSDITVQPGERIDLTGG